MEANDFRSMSHEELVKQLIGLRLENAHLKETIGEFERRKNDVVSSSPKYSISSNVLVCGGPAKSRIQQVCSITDVLSKNFGRVDQREADTPVYYSGFCPDPTLGRLSTDVGRFSELSSMSFDSYHSPERMERQESTGRGSFPSTSELLKLSELPMGQKPTPLRMQKGLVRLDSDAIVSHHTLHNFAKMYNERALSPVSMGAASMWGYISDFFAKKNDYSHHAADIEPFARALISLCGEVETILRSEPHHPTITSPCYVFGDIHGNFKDLEFFLSKIVCFDDMHFVPYNIVFLGDYVDRGQYSVEVFAKLLAMKALEPGKVTLLRGNHEDVLVSGDTRTYGNTCLKGQCMELFGAGLGEEVWKRCSRVFVWLPLSANIDNHIFCTHGGLPRYSGGVDRRMELLRRNDFPRFESLFLIPEEESLLHRLCRDIATDCCWSDPADDETTMNQWGFGPNPRGNGVYMFGSRAVDHFLEAHGFNYIFRAHQEKSDGLKVSKNSRVVTIFSTSSYVGHDNGAGVVFVSEDKIRLVIKLADEIHAVED